MKNNKKFLQISLILVVFFGFAGYIVYKAKDFYPSEKKVEKNTGVDNTTVQIGGNFILKDVNGNNYSLSQNLKKQYALIFFGYSKCPEICPKTLTNIFVGMGENPNFSEIFQPIFITLDPNVDTSEILKEFSKNFDDKILMLTGSSEEIKKIAADYKIYHSRNKETNEIDHSSVIYIVGKDGKYIDHVMGLNLEEFNAKLKDFIEKNN